MRASFATVSIATVSTIVVFATTVSFAVATLFPGFFVSILVITAAISGLGALVMTPVGVVCAITAHRVLFSSDSALVHSLGAFVAGAATGATAGFITAITLARAGELFGDARVSSMLIGTCALVAGVSSAAGWKIAFAISR